VQESASTRFGKRLRELREGRNWTQEKTAEVCGIGYKLYQLYELGIKTNPGLVTLEKLARGFDMDVSELLARKLSKGAQQDACASNPPKKPQKPRRKKRRK